MNLKASVQLTVAKVNVRMRILVSEFEFFLWRGFRVLPTVHVPVLQ